MRRWWIALAVAAVVLAIALKLGVCDCGWSHAQAWPSLWLVTDVGGWLCHVLTISGLTMAGTIATAIIILVQARFLLLQNQQTAAIAKEQDERASEIASRQNQLHAPIELEKEWNSERMLRLRSAWAANEGDIERLEPVLEFLEDFARFRSDKMLTDEAVWDTIVGWHAALYYFYNRDNIQRLREKWEDDFLFKNLAELWQAYLKEEIERRKITPEELEKKLLKTKPHFMKAERELLWK
jgi:hypothetical protein